MSGVQAFQLDTHVGNVILNHTRNGFGSRAIICSAELTHTTCSFQVTHGSTYKWHIRKSRECDAYLEPQPIDRISHTALTQKLDVSMCGAVVWCVERPYTLIWEIIVVKIFSCSRPTTKIKHKNLSTTNILHSNLVGCVTPSCTLILRQELSLRYL